MQVALTCLIFSFMAFKAGICYTDAGVRFLLIAPDARARGMGEGGSAFSDGAVSAHYNPANLVGSGKIAADISYCNYLPDLVDDFSFKSVYISGHAQGPYYWGAGFNYFDLGTLTRFDESRGYITEDNYYEAFSLYGAAKIRDSSLGIGIKYIKSQILDGWGGMIWETRKPSTFAIDLGYQIRNRFQQLTLVRDKANINDLNDNLGPEKTGGINLGVSVLNLGPDMEYSSYWNEKLPRQILVAAGYQVIATRYYDLKLTLDAGKFLLENNSGFSGEWDEIEWSYGLELKYYDFITLRGGAHNDRDGHQRYWTSGAGLGPDWLHADFSYVSKSDESWNSHGGEYTFALAFNMKYFSSRSK
jgi:hypothetical protein